MNSNRQYKWDKRFLELAEHISLWSKDPSTKVGSIITDGGNRIVSVGYNGLPAYVQDDEEVLNNREEKYKFIIHAEMNALLTAAKDVVGYTIYTYPFLPCPNCASMLIQAGIMRVVSYKCVNEQWMDRLSDSKRVFSKADIEVVELDPK